jgi:hypothetical protein
MFQLHIVVKGHDIIDPATKYREGAPSFSAFLAEKGGKLRHRFFAESIAPRSHIRRRPTRQLAIMRASACQLADSLTRLLLPDP